MYIVQYYVHCHTCCTRCVHETFVLYFDFVGRGALLPKDIKTVWKVMELAHEDMSAKLRTKTIVIKIPEEVRCINVQVLCNWHWCVYTS